MNRKKVSKHLAYLLRHNPEGLNIDDRGFVNIEQLLNKLSQRWPRVDESYLQRVVNEDPKGRYEIVGVLIRARYGHSIPVEPDLPVANQSTLFIKGSPEDLLV